MAFHSKEILLCLLIGAFFVQQTGAILSGIEDVYINKSRGLTDKEKNYLVAMHNLYRIETAKGNFKNKPSASNMKKMKWDEKAAEHAQAWADKCKFKHGGNPGEGQNLAASSDRPTVLQSTFQMWNDNEAEKWNWVPPQKGTDWMEHEAGHFSQAVWANSDGVGCGYNACKDKGVNMGFVVCNYSPQGNYMGEAPYKIGNPCEDCPSGYKCEQGALCAERGRASPQQVKKRGRASPQQVKKPTQEEIDAIVCVDDDSFCKINHKWVCTCPYQKWHCPNFCKVCDEYKEKKAAGKIPY